MLSDKNAKTSAIPKRFGILKSLNLAVFNSIIPTTIAITINFKTNIRTAIHQHKSEPNGKNRFAKIDAKIPNFNAEAISIKAKFAPVVSNTIASCTIVSSKCVSGISTGIHQFSAIKITKKLIAAKIKLAA